MERRTLLAGFLGLGFAPKASAEVSPVKCPVCQTPAKEWSGEAQGPCTFYNSGDVVWTGSSFGPEKPCQFPDLVTRVSGYQAHTCHNCLALFAIKTEKK